MANSLFNPFYMQKFFGQNIITSKLQPGGIKEVVSNVIYLSAYFVCFGVAISSIDKKSGEMRYNFISQMRFCVQLYFTTFLLVQISFSMTFNRKRYVNAFHGLINLSAQLRKINVHTKYNIVPIVIMYVVVFVSASIMFGVDVHTFWNMYNLPVFICHYLPSLAISVYIISISALTRICSSKYKSINGFLEGLTFHKNSSIKKYNLNKRNERIDKLLANFPGEQCSIFQKIFIMHDELTQMCRLINSMSGYDLLTFMIIVTVDILSFVYDICMDLSLSVTGAKLPPRNIYAIEYWSIMTLLGMMALISCSSGLMDAANDTKIYLHQLRNLYPQLDEHVEMYSLQLLHSELNISAARFFTIHRGIFYKLLSAWITYIVIFMQLDTDISTVDGE